MATKTIDQLTAAGAALLTQEFEIYDPAGVTKSQKITGLQLLTLFFGGATDLLKLHNAADTDLVIRQNDGGPGNGWALAYDKSGTSLRVIISLAGVVVGFIGATGSSLTLNAASAHLIDAGGGGYHTDGAGNTNADNFGANNGDNGTFLSNDGKTITVVQGIITSIV